MPELRYEKRAPAAWIRLDRPAALNSLTARMIADLQVALDEAESAPDVRVLVITGAGRAFCAGADLKDMASADGSGGAAAHMGFLRRVAAAFRRIETFPKPVIAAVNGYALAGGLELALCCDLIVATRSAQLGDAHANYGLIPGGGASVRLPRKIGVNRAKYLLYTGTYLPAQTLEEWGLVNQVVDDEALEGCVTELAELLAKKSPLGLARMKQLVEDGLAQPVESAVRCTYSYSTERRRPSPPDLHPVRTANGST
jgi:enoyl-CoA hydratase